MEGLDDATREEQHGILGGVLEQVMTRFYARSCAERGAPVALPAHDAAVVKRG
jgi:hypothetical protein